MTKKFIRIKILDMLFFRNVFAIFLLCACACLGVLAQDEDDQQKALELFNKGQDAHEKNDYATALKFYEEALKLFPDVPEIEYQKGNALFSLNRLDEAETTFRKVIELKEDWSLPMTSLGSLLIKKNQFTEAENYLNKAISLDEQNPTAIIALAELRLKTKAKPETLKDSLTKLQVFTSKMRPTASLWTIRGAIERQLGDNASAKVSFNKALNLEPNNAWALNEKINILLVEGDFTSALDEAQKLVKISPDFNTKFLLARVYAENGNATESLKILETLDAKNTDVISLKKAITANSSTDIADLEKQLETDAKNPTILGRLCSLTRTVDANKSLNYCRLALESEPNNINHAIIFAGALAQTNRHNEAIIVLNRILKIAPDNYEAHRFLAVSLFELKNYAEAKKEFQWITNKKSDAVIAYFFLAICHDNLQEYLDAMANYQKFLQLADKDKNQLEIEKVNLRLPSLQRQIKEGKGKKS
ncbi:MAG: tetratricopeptide repeat protein [Pyrinomonadaceae bacterium]|nr:tetratricopeptide repeat protein [Pyrinomonadaceae bacterium]